MMLFVLLPIIVFLSLAAMFYAAPSLFTSRCWRSACLLSSTILVLIITLSTEIFSLLRAITRFNVMVFWGLLAGMSLAFMLVFYRKALASSPIVIRPNVTFDTMMTTTIIAMICTLGVIAVVAPPNNWDSLRCYMSRVMYWVQNRSIAHYPTPILEQLYINPFAGYAIMHLQLLTGSDYFANMVQWLSMVGSCVGVSLIARQFGATLRFQILASLISITIPMGILQATSTQTDYVNSFLLVSLVFYLLHFRTSPRIVTIFCIGTSLGGAVLAKPTAYIYAFPFMVWFGGMLLISPFRIKQKLGGIMLIVVMFLTVNGGHYARNYKLFHSPLGITSGSANEIFSVKSLTSNVIRNIVLHLQVPYHKVGALEPIRQIEQDVIDRIHAMLGLDSDDPRTTTGEEFEVAFMSTHEDLAGNLVHFLVLVGCLSLLGLQFRKFTQPAIFIYVGCLLLGFLLMCLYLKWSPWRSRHHLALFVLAAPFMSVVMQKTCSAPLVKLLSVVFVLQSTLWLFHNYTRPLLGKENIFKASRIEQYFKNRPELITPYLALSEEIHRRHPQKIGIVLEPNSWDYPLWVLTDALRNNIQIHYVHVTNVSAILGGKERGDDLIVTIDNTINRIDYHIN